VWDDINFWRELCKGGWGGWGGVYQRGGRKRGGGKRHGERGKKGRSAGDVPGKRGGETETGGGKKDKMRMLPHQLTNGWGGGKRGYGGDGRVGMGLGREGTRKD